MFLIILIHNFIGVDEYDEWFQSFQVLLSQNSQSPTILNYSLDYKRHSYSNR